MNHQLLQSLDLFTLPPPLIKKTKEQKKQEQQIQSQYRDFFNGAQPDVLMDETELERQQKEREQQELNRKREQHLMQLDATKKLYISEIMRRGNMYDNQSYLYGDMNDEDKERIELSQDIAYFKSLQNAIKVEYEEDPKKGKVIKTLSISEFCVRITYVDKILKAYKVPIIELTLNSTFITASECLVLASNPRAKDLQVLDLSCNPITVQGLLYLISPINSEMQKLQCLKLVSCDIDQTQTYMISNDKLGSGKCKFTLRSLNLSHNKLNLFLNYVTELDLINPDLESLDLVECDITDEQILNLIQSNKLIRLEHLDLSKNKIEKTFPLLIKYLKENCDHLTNIYLKDNPQMKQTQTFQISKSKKASGLPLLIRLDLQRSLRGDQQVIQLSQSSYLKDLRYLNLRDCKIAQKGFIELLQSPQLRSLEILILRKNRIKYVEGPYSDLEDTTEKQDKKNSIMRLKLLDLRENKLTSIFYPEAVNFLKDTVLLMWDNPIENKGMIRKEYYDPAHLFRATVEFNDDYRLMQNPLHLFNADEKIREMFEDI